jgi:hypothetical protein
MARFLTAGSIPAKLEYVVHLACILKFLSISRFSKMAYLGPEASDAFNSSCPFLNSPSLEMKTRKMHLFVQILSPGGASGNFCLQLH